MPSKGNFTWHPPFSGVNFRFFAQLIIHVYNFSLPDTWSYGILEYRRNLYHVNKCSTTVDVDIWFRCLRLFSL